ncbi:MAG: DUF6691 family protein [Bacteroidota bacterium]
MEDTNHITSSISIKENIKYLLVGILFGIVFVKAEIISWFRIYEMFTFRSFHMFGVIGTALTVATISVFLIKKFKIKTIQGNPIEIKTKTFHKGQIYGSILFGCGWSLSGACPGPLFAQVGAGFMAVIVSILFALFGTWCYGYFKDKLPH